MSFIHTPVVNTLPRTRSEQGPRPRLRHTRGSSRSVDDDGRGEVDRRAVAEPDLTRSSRFEHFLEHS